MAIEERWVDVENVAAHLGVAKDSVYRWIDERGLPARRVGRLLRFKISEIDEWVRQGNERAQAPYPDQSRSSLKSQADQSTPKTRSRKRGGDRA
jgi:excisionase family DNA binding protein